MRIEAAPSEMSSEFSVAKKGPRECLATGLTHLETSDTRASIRSLRMVALVSGSAPGQQPYLVVTRMLKLGEEWC